MEEVIQRIKREGIPVEWSDTLHTQALYSNQQKGYLKKVTWKHSTLPGAGIGIFAEESLKKGEVLRVMEEGKNAIFFHSEKDIPPLDNSYTRQYLQDNLLQLDDILGICIPMTAINHRSTRHNSTLVKISATVFHNVICEDVQAGEEIVNNYVEYGEPPAWLKMFAKTHNIAMPFKGCNDYV